MVLGVGGLRAKIRPTGDAGVGFFDDADGLVCGLAEESVHHGALYRQIAVMSVMIAISSITTAAT